MLRTQTRSSKRPDDPMQSVSDATTESNGALPSVEQWNLATSQPMAAAILKVTLGGTEMIFPFSDVWPANYNFSLFSKLPTNYPKISAKIQKTYVNIPQSGIFRCVNYIFSEIFG